MATRKKTFLEGEGGAWLMLLVPIFIVGGLLWWDRGRNVRGVGRLQSGSGGSSGNNCWYC